MYVHSTKLLKTEDSIKSSTFTTITNLPNTVITADTNAHLLYYYSIRQGKTLEEN